MDNLNSTCENKSPFVKFDKINSRYKFQSIKDPVTYSPSAYGIDEKCTGEGVKIVLLDTGHPSHPDIKVIGEKVSFCEQNQSPVDRMGHGTMMAGIISSNNIATIRGLAPRATTMYGKVVSNTGECSFTSLVTGVLWSIIKGADIIVMGLGTDYDYSVLHDAIKKAHSAGICIFAAAGNNIEEIDLPADYKEVFSCGYLTRSKSQNEIIKKKVDFYLPYKTLTTTYLGNQYIKVGGSSIATAFFAGLAANLIEEYKKKKSPIDPSAIHIGLNKICNEKLG